MNQIKEKLLHVWDIICQKTPSKTKKILHSIYNTPLLMFSSIAMIICVLVLGVAFSTHNQKENQNPLDTLNSNRSHVLSEEVAAMYDSLGAPVIDRTNSSPEVFFGEDDSNQLTASGALTVTISDSISSSATSTPQSTSAPTLDNSTINYELLDIPTAPPYERENNFIDGYQPNQTPTRPPQYIYPTAAPANTIINCSMPYGTEVTQSEIYIIIHSSDDTGNSVPAKYMNVTLNNVPVQARFTHSNGAVTYALTLTAGANQLIVQAPNSIGVVSQLEQMITYTPPTVPVITISVEAQTAGYGYLIPPTQVPLVNNQPISYYVTNLLTQYGYTYTHTGTVENNFSLKSIGKPSAFAVPAIPNTLIDAIAKDTTDPQLVASFNPQSFNADYLGEGNFTYCSGWLFTVNNQNMGPNISLLPTANDNIRFCYSLAYGKDLGLFYYSDGTNGSYNIQL